MSKGQSANIWFLEKWTRDSSTDGKEINCISWNAKIVIF